MKRECIILSMIVFSFFSIIISTVADGEFSGNAIMDFYKVELNNNSEIAGMEGFWFRRIYLTYEDKLSENSCFRLRFEMSDPGDFISKEKYVLTVKDSYLKFKFSGKHEFILGITSPPTFKMVEKLWGYRCVEKTPLDLQKFASSRDFGLSLGRKMRDGKFFSYQLMLANGTGNKSEDNKGKKAFLSLGFHPCKAMYFEIYSDYDYINKDENKQTVQGFFAYTTGSFRTGFLYAVQTRTDAVESKDYSIGSIYSVFNPGIGPEFIIRLDKTFEPNSKGNEIAYTPFNPDFPSNLIILGTSFRINDKVLFIPNLEYITYEDWEDTEAPDNELFYRFTLYYKW